MIVEYFIAAPSDEWIRARAREGAEVFRTARATDRLFDYCFAYNGVFVRAKRDGLDVLIPVAECAIRGLAEVEARIELKFPRVPVAYLEKMLELSREICVETGRPTEALFHLFYLEEKKRWRLDKPEQEATGGSVRPLDDGPDSSYARALIELHSHHEMPAFFSGTDDADEQGFRIYAVIGDIFTNPKIRVRVGVYGQFYELPAADIFEIPDSLEDAHDEDRPE